MNLKPLSKIINLALDDSTDRDLSELLSLAITRWFDDFQILSSRAGTLGLIALFLLSVLLSPTPSAQAETIQGPETRFSPDEGQPLFPAGNLNVFKQFIIGLDISERVGKTVEIDLFFDSLEFGGELSAGVRAAFGLEVGLCFGGNADFDLAFKPTITLPDKYPFDVPIPLTVSEGFLKDDSHFTTTFPPLGKAYADLIFDLGAQLKATACVFGCFDAIDFDFSTCDIPALQPSGVKLFNNSKRCDPSLDAKTFCSIELASFNRNDDNVLRMLNVGANNRVDFLKEPYKEYAPSLPADSKKLFFVDTAIDTLLVSGAHSFSDGKQVQLSTSGTPPGGLSSSRVYYVTNLEGNEFELATRAGGPAVNITNDGVGNHEVSLSEMSDPDAPALGKYGTLSISAPTVATDSRISSTDDSKKPFTVDPVNDRLILLALPGFRNGAKVRISSLGKVPEGLSSSCVYYVTNSLAAGLNFQLSTKSGGPPVNITDAGTGTHRISLNAEFNTAEVLKSSGAEDIMNIGIDVPPMVADFLFPPPSIPLADSGAEGPLDWNYTLASLSLGPAVQLQTDFEMTWDLDVTEITFREPGTANPRTVKIDGQPVTEFKPLPGTVHLTNCGPKALPEIQLISTDPVEVSITYTLKPKLKTVVSTPFIGQLNYKALAAGASVDGGR